MAKMRLEDALKKILALEGKRVGEIGSPDLVNKGAVGQIVERKIGINLSSDLLDFEDGELKSNKFLRGKPAETLAVTQVGHILPEIEGEISWPNSKILKKISSFVFLPIHKDEPNPSDWLIGRAVHFSKENFPAQYKSLGEDYLSIARQIKLVIENSDELHTINGPNQFLQIRTKDSKDKSGNYHPIKYNGVVLSNKNYAFYIRPGFLNSVLNKEKMDKQ
jgi:DNA mismatch repair endonuclease MutH